MIESPAAYKQPPANAYVRLSSGGRSAVACQWVASFIRDVLARNTLYEWAARQESHDIMHGRGVSYGVEMPVGPEARTSVAAVVRHNRHGGLLRWLTGDCFVTPSRAPLELENSLRLLNAGVPTPEVIAYALYPVARFWVRCDVITRRIPDGADFPDVWHTADPQERMIMLEKLIELLRMLEKAGAWHQDLNLKNIFIAGKGSNMQAYLLDVDRVVFPGISDVMSRNLKRLTRSIRKWRTARGLDIGEDVVAQINSLAERGC